MITLPLCVVLFYRNLQAVRQTIHPGCFDPMGRRVAFGVGTGLGVKDAVLLRCRFWLGNNELGHIGITLPPKMNRVESTVHREFIRFLQDHDELHGAFISFETILSGKGWLAFINLFRERASFNPEETVSEIKASDIESLKLFGWYLGLFVGALQLMFMPSGGIWIHGGVINKNLELFNEPCLRRFCRELSLHRPIGNCEPLFQPPYYKGRSMPFKALIMRIIVSIAWQKVVVKVIVIQVVFGWPISLSM